jgi:polar amino acid transport system permease protein
VTQVLEYWPALIQGLMVTVWVAVASITGAAAGALLLGSLRLSQQRAVRMSAVALIELIRGASALVLLFWVFYALPLVPGMPHMSPMTAAILVLSLIGASYGAEIVRSGIETIPRGQLDACHALGLTRYQAFSRIVLPQALSQIVPAFGSLAADMVKWTSIVSFVGVQDLLYAANSVRSATYATVPVFCLLAVMYWALCVLSGAGFRALESVLPLNRALNATGASSSRKKRWTGVEVRG